MFLVGLLALATGPLLDDVAFSGVAVGLMALVLVSTWASHGWTDRPVDGLRRFLAGMPFVLVVVVCLGAMPYLAYGVALVMIDWVSQDPWVLLFVIPLVAVLVLIQRKAGVAELLRVSLSGAMFPTGGTMSANGSSPEEHRLTYMNIIKRLRL